MTDSAKLRLVRCPKCDNLLQELDNYSVYQCGGCGAVLRAKDKDQKVETSVENTDEERTVQDLANSTILSEKAAVSVCDVSDMDAKLHAATSCEQRGLENADDGYHLKSKNLSKVSADNLVVENDIGTRMSRHGFDKPTGRESSQNEYTCKPQRSGRMLDWQIGEMDEFRRDKRINIGDVRFSTSNYPDEGPSNYHSDASYGFKEPIRKSNDPNAASRVQYLENDRAELLRKLDELKDQLSRSCDVVDKPKESVPLGMRMVPPDPYCSSDTRFPDGSSGSNRASMQLQGSDKHGNIPPYTRSFPEPFPYTNRYEPSLHGFYPSVHNSNHIHTYGDPFGSQMLRKAPHNLPGHYQQASSQTYFPEQYIDTNRDSFEPYTHNTVFHHPSCSCFHCYEKIRRVSAPVGSSSFYNKRCPDFPNNTVMYHHEPSGFASHAHNSMTAIPPLISRDLVSHTRWPSELNSKMDCLARSRPQRVVLGNAGRRCRPIAGGSPFLTCYNCFEFLQLPKKIMLMAKNQQKVQCGACSTVINFSIVNKKLVLSVHAERKKLSAELNSNTNVNRSSANFSSEDYDNCGYEFLSMDREPVASLTDQDLCSSKPQEMKSFLSSSLSTSEDENSPDSVVCAREVTNTVLLPKNADLSPPLAGSPLQEHFDYSSNNHVVNRFTKGNRSSRSDHDVMMSTKVATRQNSVKETSLATEMDVSFNEYSNTGISQESRDPSRIDDRAPVIKGGESFFSNIIKKSFKDFSRSNHSVEHGSSNVWINGRSIPDRLVKKAEKIAGPVRPGKYWYDVHAGFWGVMGGPGLGIIPPNIEEFNHPIPENCAGGNTGIFVNGRELHQKDLDLLCSRGLPTARGRSYKVDISGRVVDGDSGEELESLGKLAPTIERVKHGFGMKSPRTATR